MKPMSVVVTAFLVCIFATSVNAEEGLNEIGEAFVKAFKAGDLDAIASLYAPDSVSFPPDTMVANGPEGIRASWAGLLDNYTVTDLVITDPHHETSGDLSTAWGNYKMILSPKTGGLPVVMEGRFTDVAKRIDGRWLYVNDHASLPLPPPPAESE